MTWDFQIAAARRTRRLVIGLVLLVVVLIGGILALAFRPGPATRPGAAFSPAGAASPASAVSPVTSIITPDPNFVAPARWVRLPPATSTRDGFPTGFPHTPQGAVAAAAAIAQGATWDLDAADRATQAYSLPAQQAGARAQAQQDVMTNRQANGLPATGPLPAGAGLNSVAIGVAWTPITSDRVEVSVLARITYTTPAAGPKTVALSSHDRMVWSDGDWYAVAYTPDGTTKLLQPADLGSQSFNDAGWTAIQQGSAG